MSMLFESFFLFEGGVVDASRLRNIEMLLWSLAIWSKLVPNILQKIEKCGPRVPQGGQNRSKGVPPAVPKDRSDNNRATPGQVHANGSKMGGRI